MTYWFILSDPEDYHFDDLLKKGGDTWDGVFGTAAQRYLGEIKKGDRLIGYHTAPEKAAVITLEALCDAYQNPEIKDRKNWVVDLKPVAKLKKAVPLADLKGNANLKGMKLFKMVRPISVSPLTKLEYEEILRMGG